MALKDRLRLTASLGASAKGIYRLTRCSHSSLVVHDRLGVIEPSIRCSRKGLRLGEILVREVRQLWHPSTDKLAGRIVVQDLFLRTVNPHGVDPSRTALHLNLRVMNAWLEVHEMASQKVSCLLPGYP